MVAASFIGALSMVASFITQGLNSLILFPQLIRKGPCPDPPPVQYFQLESYLGRWYELERYNNFFQNGDCVTADYSLFKNGSISVVNSQVTNGELNSILGLARSGPNPNVGDLIVTFPGPFGNTNEPNYKIVTTDYTTFSVVYSCSAFLGKRLEFSWILAREPYLPKSKLQEIKNLLKKKGIDISRYMPTRQTGCKRRRV